MSRVNKIQLQEGPVDELTVMSSIPNGRSYRDLGWDDGSKFNFFVDYTLGEGDCYLVAFWQAIKRLSSAPQNCLFLRDPNFINLLFFEHGGYNIKYLDMDFTNPIELMTFFKIDLKTAQRLLIRNFRLVLGSWLEQPYFDGQKHISPEEATNILKDNVDNIKIWFRSKFYSNNWTYENTMKDATIFLTHLVVTYIDNVNNMKVNINQYKQYLNSLDVIDNNQNIMDYLNSGVEENELFAAVKSTNFKGVPFGDYFSQNYGTSFDKIIQAAAVISQYPPDTYYKRYYEQLKESNLLAVIGQLSPDQLTTVIKEIQKTQELTPYFIQSFMVNPKHYKNYIEPYLTIDMSKDEKFLNILRNNTILELVNTYVSEGFETDQIITWLCTIPDGRFRQALTVYITNFRAIANWIKGYIAVNLNHKKYVKYPVAEVDSMMTKEDLVNLASRSIYYNTDRNPTVAEIEAEFNLDFLYQTTDDGYIMPKYYTDPHTKILQPKYKEMSEDVLKPRNINYFMLEEGLLVRKGQNDYIYDFLHNSLSKYNEWVGQNVIFVLSLIFDIEVHIFESYNKNFMWRYQFSTGISVNPPIVMINYTTKHYETCGYTIEKGQDSTYFYPDSEFWRFLRNYDQYHTKNGNIMTKDEWYQENKQHLKSQPNKYKLPPHLPHYNLNIPPLNPIFNTKIPVLPGTGPNTEIPVLPGTTPNTRKPVLPGTAPNTGIPVLPGTEPVIKTNQINPNKMLEALRLAREYQLDLRNDATVAYLIDAFPDLTQP